MSKMLRKKLISAELMVASSLLLVPGFTLTGQAPRQAPPRQTLRPPPLLLRLPRQIQIRPLLTQKCQESSKAA
jgi:hypothetical protein